MLSGDEKKCLYHPNQLPCSHRKPNKNESFSLRQPIVEGKDEQDVLLNQMQRALTRMVELRSSFGISESKEKLRLPFKNGASNFLTNKSNQKSISSSSDDSDVGSKSDVSERAYTPYHANGFLQVPPKAFVFSVTYIDVYSKQDGALVKELPLLVKEDLNPFNLREAIWFALAQRLGASLSWIYHLIWLLF